MGHVFISADIRLRIHDLIKHTEGMTQAKLAKELGISESIPLYHSRLNPVTFIC